MQDYLLSPLELLKEFYISSYIKRDAESAVACLSKDIHWVDTSDDEEVHNIREAADYITHQISCETAPYRIEFLEERENIISAGLGTASVKIKITSGGLSAVKRVTAVAEIRDGVNRICEMHASVPDVNQSNGVYLPYEFAWDKADGQPCQESPEQMETEHNPAEQNAAGRKLPDQNTGFVHRYATKSFWKEHRSTVLVLSVVLALIIAVVCFAFYLTKTQWKATTSTIKTASLAATECVSSAVQADRLIISDIAQLVGRSNSQDRAELLEGVQAETTFREIIAVFEDGTSCSSLGASPGEIERSLEQMEFPEGEDVSRPYYGTTGRKQVTYRRDIVTDGEKAGVLYGAADLSKYYAPSVMEFYNGKGFSYVIDVQSGDFLIYTTRTMSQGAYRDFYTVLQESESEEEIQNLKQVLMSGKAGSTIIDLLGARTYLYFVPLEGGSNRYLITMVPYGVMRAESSGLVYIVVSFVAAVILAAGIVLFLNERMARTKAKERGYRAMLFHLLSENVDSVFFIYDTDAGRLDYVSQNTKRILGIESMEFAGNHFLKTSLMPESERLEQIRGFWKQKCNFAIEYSYRNPITGNQQLLRLSGYIPSDKAWQNKWIFCVDDRTEDVLKERKLEQAVREAEKANYAKTEFLANMSHDIRTPMNGIIGMTQLALMDGVDSHKMRTYMERIEGSATFLLSLINDILDMSKIESGNVELNFEPYSIPRLRVYLESVILPLCREKDIVFEAEVEDSLCFLADQKRLDQILFNLLSNAVKYTKNSGRVRFSMHAKKQEDDLLHLVICVKDSGIGMTKEFQKKMFQPFAQEERKIAGMNGTGLGLAIVKNLVDLMGGNIRVESRVGEGSSFWIELYVSAAELPEEEEVLKEWGAGSSRLRNIHILLCEDNAMNQEIMVSILETMGILTDVAADGQQGVDFYLDHAPGYYKAVLMDCRMPVMDGYEATRMIREAGRPDSGKIPILALTADAFEDDRRRCMDAGMSGFLTKPVDIQNLEKVLNQSIQEEDSV
ncbi:ATP-binding protein [Extibacter muris]|uniref:ATP-binding protein n=1 Tax=Extibacter muris TaxID=1796622 RepID=UPI001D0830A2|nr:ATP-binding protein [Extibacter muris]MCB6200467.1 response regulator [Extibacter muris]MCQ4663422.1 ATP-binding protein [Extibacter muris]MCQ4692846.1 ATP-binding protein [Extibacter muris]